MQAVDKDKIIYKNVPKWSINNFLNYKYVSFKVISSRLCITSGLVAFIHTIENHTVTAHSENKCEQFLVRNVI
jgi:hypothetical protein